MYYFVAQKAMTGSKERKQNNMSMYKDMEQVQKFGLQYFHEGAALKKKTRIKCQLANQLWKIISVFLMLYCSPISLLQVQRWIGGKGANSRPSLFSSLFVAKCLVCTASHYSTACSKETLQLRRKELLLLVSLQELSLWSVFGHMRRCSI